METFFELLQTTGLVNELISSIEELENAKDRADAIAYAIERLTQLKNEQE